ncbi:hypothetical protein J6590_038701 [Homalodisca vitripennis]|nr:hypothetical protein J6590_038701 [Homalodisca vitripennis]
MNRFTNSDQKHAEIADLTLAQGEGLTVTEARGGVGTCISEVCHSAPTLLFALNIRLCRTQRAAVSPVRNLAQASTHTAHSFSH